MRLYFDYNATAPIRPEVKSAVEPILFGANTFGNASSIHWAGQEARRHLEHARSVVASIFGRRASEVIFTSGGSEADNLALLGVALRPDLQPARVLISTVEHPAVLNSADRLKELGVTVEHIPTDQRGLLDLDALDRALDKKTTLVSVMAVNNETGVISPIEEVTRRAHGAGAIVHVDAVQAAGRIPLPLTADLISISGHKLGALKGIGALIARENVHLRPTLLGGPQERGRRAGTEPVASAISLAVALELATSRVVSEAARLGDLQRILECAIDAIDGTEIIGRGAPRVSGTTSALFSDIEGESLLVALDLAGVAASSGSACASGSIEPSHVLLAMRVPPAMARGAVRFSFGWATTESEVTTLCERLRDVVHGIRGVPTFRRIPG